MNQFNSKSGIHAAIIMDGNGRWAQARGLPRVAGHREGANAVRRVVESAPGCGIRVLTLYAFSRDNWTRPAGEVAALMRLLQQFIESETSRCIREGVRLRVIGSRDRLSSRLCRAIEAAESATAGGDVLDLRIAMDYSSRDEMLAAMTRIPDRHRISREEFASLLAHVNSSDAPSFADVDLLIRTGGEKRLSDFLLWECAYAELYFTDVMWPDFDKACLREAVNAFHGRNRRFGQIPHDSDKPAARQRDAAHHRERCDLWLH